MRTDGFAARPSGTENIYKIYAESIKSQSHLNAILDEARQIVTRALGRMSQFTKVARGYQPVSEIFTLRTRLVARATMVQ